MAAVVVRSLPDETLRALKRRAAACPIHVIVLDGNVVPGSLGPSADRNVLAGLDRQAPETLHPTAPTVAGLWPGIALLPAGKRRTPSQQALAEDVLGDFPAAIAKPVNPRDAEAA